MKEQGAMMDTDNKPFLNFRRNRKDRPYSWDKKMIL